MQADEEQRRRVIYSGRVQGVGFRYTTAAIARRFPVAGYVRNLPDGTVELVAEAEPRVLDEFLGEIAAEFQGNIRDCQVDSDDSGEQFTGFKVRFW